ncbi:MAG: hypothetical protein FWF20_06285 [Betaproteobacteria bacterium]|nr:hypothetical protein [Betaproteobacteria bacterium]MCL2886376.1 hypothetical protein [Betaproteobacteria bacterium]
MTLIPTSLKEKIPKGFAYPIGAEVISHALDGVSQFHLLKLTFFWKNTFWASKYNARINSAGTIKIIEVRYSSHSQMDTDWNIYVHAVPSAESQFVRDQLLDNALPKLKERLLKAKLESEFFSWETSYDMAARSIFVGQ